MASRSVALVNRLRLGEAPSAVDCTLAARVLALDGAATDFLDLHDDLVATVSGESGARRLRVRVALVGETARLLERAIEETLGALTRYFALRSEVEGDGEDEEPTIDLAGEEEPAEEQAERPLTGVAAGLADLAVPARVGESFELGLGELGDACRRFQTGLADLLAGEPETEVTLDFLSTIEADLGLALADVLHPDFADGETPYRAGLATLAASALVTS